MKVAIVTESFLPTTNGVTNSVVQVNRELVRSGAEIRILAPAAPGLHEEVDGTQVVALPALNLQRHLPVAFPNLKVFRELQRFNPDVVHLASPAIMGAHAQRTANRLGIPTIAVYQTDFVGFAKHYKFAFAKKAIEQCVKIIHADATLNLAPSTYAIQQLQSIGIERVFHWGRGVDLEQFHPRNRRESTYAQFRPKLIVGYVGRLAPEKSIERLAPLSKRDDIQLVVIGSGPSERELRELMPNAYFTGKLQGVKLAEYFAGLDVFIHPGDSETFCQAAQEALASGVPVIAPNKGGLKDFIKPGSNGLVLDLSDPNSLRNISTAEWSFLCSALVKTECRNSVAQKSWRALTAQLQDFYQFAIQLNVNSDLNSAEFSIDKEIA